MTEKGAVIKIADTPATSEKLSLHGSGVVKFRQSDGSFDPERVKGYFLLKNKEKEVAPRHLFTGFMSEPKYLPESRFGNRKSDIEIIAHEHKAFVIVFFTIPQKKIPLEINFNPIFDIDLFGEDFAKNIGFGSFSLSYHDVLWFAYKTKDIIKWPRQSHVFYYDGFLVPLFIGRKNDTDSKYRAMVAVLQEPHYKYKNNNLRITLAFPRAEDILKEENGEN